MNFEVLVNEFVAKENVYRAYSEEIENLIRKLLRDKGLGFYSITSRTKDKESLKNKIINKDQKYQSLSEITDLCGVRIITYYTNEVDAIADLLENEFVVDGDNTIDKRKAIDPDKFGYLSLHYVLELNEDRLKLAEYSKFRGIKVEIQVRTILQHTWAEINHDLGYKSKIGIPREVQRDFSRLAGLLELADKEFLGIRENLREYAVVVNEKMGKNDDVILIDDVSIRECIKNNSLVKELNQKISEKMGWNLLDVSDDSINETINRLIWNNNFQTIEDINNGIGEYNDLIVFMIKRMFIEISPIEECVGLDYLALCKVVETRSINHIVSFYKKLGYSGGLEAFARRQLKIYEEYLNQR